MALRSVFNYSARAFSTSSALRMPSLVVAEVLEGGKVGGGLGNTLTAANQIDADVDVLVTGPDAAAAATDIASGKYGKVRSVLNATTEETAHNVAEKVAPVVLGAQKEGNYTHIITASTNFGKNIIPRVAALLDVAAITDVMKVLSANSFVRPIYAGNALATVESDDSVKVLSIRSANFSVEPAEGLGAPVKDVSADCSGVPATEWLSNEIAVSERPELASASIVVAGGRGLKEPENFKMVEELADQLGGAVGATRAIVDAGWVPNDMQIGQTGKVVAPDLYIGVGISGAIQHLAGMKDSKVIVAINKDEEAPIFTVADYGIVGDVFKVMPELMAELKK